VQAGLNLFYLSIGNWKSAVRAVLGVMYFDVLELAPLFNLSFDPNIKIQKAIVNSGKSL